METSKGQPSPNEDAAATNWLRLLSCFLFPLFLSVLISLLYRPLKAQFMAEEYLDLARQSSGVPSSLLRPPGYVAFLHFINVVSGGINLDRLAPVYIGQGVGLGLATVAWYITACRWLAALPAWLMALAFGCNPLVVAMVGYIHYDILHLGMSVLTGLLLVWTFANNPVHPRRAILAGITCGTLTLIRPMTLIEPAFLALALGLLAWRTRSHGVWLAWAAFSFAMIATIAPRTWSNYARTGRFIPVNAQTMAALWPMLEKPIKQDSNSFPWIYLWINCGRPLLEKQVGAAAFDINYLTSHPLVVEDVFAARIRELIHTRARVYLSNIAHNALFFWSGDSRMIIRAFVSLQDRKIYVIQPAWAIGFLIVSSALLHVCGAMGLVLGLWRRDPAVTILASLFICLWFAHSMVYLDYRYLYVKVPFLFWFTGYLMSECFKTSSSGKKNVLWISAAFAMSALLGTALLVF
jgi:hypothetical protein